jgi:hypothetical protein
MSPARSELLGAPHTYHVRVRCALDHPLLAAPDEAAHLLVLIERLRLAFDVRLFAYLVMAGGFHLVLRHHTQITDPDDRLRERWVRIGGTHTVSAARLRERFGSLGGFMQTLLQRFSRDRNRRHGGGGHLWAGRYRACLLADDAALIAAVTWLEDRSQHDAAPVASSHGLHGAGAGTIALATLPLRLGPDELLFTADESPPGLAPPPEVDSQRWLDRFAANLNADDRRAYGEALGSGWALGRPESLSETIARLGRSSGRGRSRQLRDLGDELGLCGVWG